MSSLQKTFRILGLVVVLAGGILALVWIKTSGMADNANAFFKAIGERDTHLAYSYFAKNYRGKVSEAEFSEHFGRVPLAPFVDASWTHRSIRNSKGRLSGAITTTKEEDVPFTLNFVKEEGEWKIASIETESNGKSRKTRGVVPSHDMQVVLFNEGARLFSEAVNRKSMQVFYPFLSDMWRKQTTIEELDTTYKGFYAIQIDVAAMNTSAPVFSKEGAMDEQGVLQIVGFYPTMSPRIYFDHEYVWEDPKWKLIGFGAEIKAEP